MRGKWLTQKMLLRIEFNSYGDFLQYSKLQNSFERMSFMP